MNVVLCICDSDGLNPMHEYDASLISPDYVPEKISTEVDLPEGDGSSVTAQFVGYGTLTITAHRDPNTGYVDALNPDKPFRYTLSWSSTNPKFTAQSLLPKSQEKHPPFTLYSTTQRVKHQFTAGEDRFLYRPRIDVHEQSNLWEAVGTLQPDGTIKYDYIEHVETSDYSKDLLAQGSEREYSFIGDYHVIKEKFDDGRERYLISTVTTLYFGIRSPIVIARVHNSEDPGTHVCHAHHRPFKDNNSYLHLSNLEAIDLALPHAIFPGKVFIGNSFYDDSQVQFSLFRDRNQLLQTVDIPEGQLKPGGPWWYVLDLKSYYRDATYLPLRHPTTGALIRARESYLNQPLIYRDEEIRGNGSQINTSISNPIDEPPLPDLS